VPANPGQNKRRSPYICISPGSRWLTKRWGVDGFFAVAKELESKGFQIVGVGASDELDVCRQILDKTKGGVNLAGQLNLTQLHGVLEKARLLISNDSGAMHMASVAGTPCVSVFGPTTPEMGYRPWNPNSIIVQNEDLKCRPCGKHGHMKCPIGTHECMISIRPEQVISASHQLLQQTKALSH
jgi:heptosyltransferase-2